MVEVDVVEGVEADLEIEKADMAVGVVMEAAVEAASRANSLVEVWDPLR